MKHVGHVRHQVDRVVPDDRDPRPVRPADGVGLRALELDRRARPRDDAAPCRRARTLARADIAPDPARATRTCPSPPLLERIREGVIGDDQVMQGPYGPRRVTYADYTAPGGR